MLFDFIPNALAFSAICRLESSKYGAETVMLYPADRMAFSAAWMNSVLQSGNIDESSALHPIKIESAPIFEATFAAIDIKIMNCNIGK